MLRKMKYILTLRRICTLHSTLHSLHCTIPCSTSKTHTLRCNYTSYATWHAQHSTHSTLSTPHSALSTSIEGGLECTDSLDRKPLDQSKAQKMKQTGENACFFCLGYAFSRGVHVCSGHVFFNRHMGVQFITLGRLEIREPQRAANKAPPPRPWKQESFATHLGKKHTWMYLDVLGTTFICAPMC